jgi:hypothetical protein
MPQKLLESPDGGDDGGCLKVFFLVLLAALRSLRHSTFDAATYNLAVCVRLGGLTVLPSPQDGPL